MRGLHYHLSIVSLNISTLEVTVSIVFIYNSVTKVSVRISHSHLLQKY